LAIGGTPHVAQHDKFWIRISLAFILLFSFSCPRLYAQSLLDSLAIEVRGTSREFTYTNKESAFYYGETNSENTSSWQGFNVFSHEFLDDYALTIDGVQLQRKNALKTIVYPDYLERYYPGNIIETLRLVDSLALFAVEIISEKPVEVGLTPYFTDGRNAQDYVIRLTEGTALMARTAHLARSPSNDYPVWLAIHSSTFLPVKRESRRGNQYSPILLAGMKAKSHIIAVAVADEPDQAEHLAKSYAAHARTYALKRRARMETLLNQTSVQTEDQRFDKALAWAKLSLDALIMNQRTKGIFAGMPWFNNYWGRDTFISLPGATLVTGHFKEARAILRSFAEFQQRDSTSTDYGRIPNIVTTTDKAYNTADGTPRFVMMAREYIQRSGDSAFAIETYPVVLRSIEGTMRYHCDSLGFLIHGDAETWMDAVGPNGPWSPRGNRANDIQALWAQQLEAGLWCATYLGDVTSAQRWNQVLQLLKGNFARHFIVDEEVTDHLNADGSRDTHLRPNQIFTTYLLDDVQRAAVVKTVVTKLTYEYGVASLSQDDENFHPYHQYGAYYPKDAAYHNGTVWTWLQGALISELCRLDQQEFAARLTANVVHQILDRGAVGTQSELLDAITRPGESEPRLSGTFSQAWNLAEFIRNFYDDYLGIRVGRFHHELTLRPHFPKSFGRVRATINLDGRALPIEVDQFSPTQIVTINGENLRVGGKAIVELHSHKGQTVTTTFRIPPRSLIRLELRDTNVTVLDRGLKQEATIVVAKPHDYSSALKDLKFATPVLHTGLQALRGPDYPLLTHAQIKATNPAARTLTDTGDPEGDDVGTGAFVYPRNPNFILGSFDVTHFSVRYDSTNAYFALKFKALSNPGWHPEYGFQLTYVAVAIDEDGVVGSGTRLEQHNASYMLDEEHAYEKLILVGGGVQLEDSGGRILAAYIPSEADISNPLGNIENATIGFALPLSYMGKPGGAWTFTVLVGGQDDHGGAGIGEFRTVNKEASEWSGGGKNKPDEPNVYDVVVCKSR
jgi:glycogen debranching enzyme